MKNTNFIPTWLYIKQHNITGLRYFGKTTKDPVTYNGSGKYWKDHIKKHSNDVTTVWCELFTDKNQLIEYALKFSSDNNIIESNEWANLILENGIDGNVPGNKRTQETKIKLSLAHKGQNAWNKGIPRTKEVKDAISRANTGKDAWNKGIPCDDKIKDAVSKANKGKAAWNKGIPRTEEEKQKIREGRKKLLEKGFVPYNKGKKESILICEHCKKSIGGQGNYKRWHGDNCKLKL